MSPVRYRIAGATVLVFVAVLFIPWLFDGAGYEYLQDLERPIPERPVVLEPFVHQLAGTPSAAVTPPDDPANVVAGRDSLPPAVRQGAGAAPQQANAGPQAPATRQPEPQRARVGWAVQVGSFGRESNAREQVQQLRQAGFPAFAEKASIEGRDVWRVKIGPEVHRDQAIRVRDQVQSRLGFAGIVIAHP